MRVEATNNRKSSMVQRVIELLDRGRSVHDAVFIVRRENEMAHHVSPSERVLTRWVFQKLLGV